MLVAWIAGPENGENLNKYVIYSEHKTFKAFINGSFLKSARERERESKTSVPQKPRQKESYTHTHNTKLARANKPVIQQTANRAK